MCGLANFGDGKIFTFNEGNELEMNKTKERGGEGGCLQ
jgi:hypothetical protein